MRKSGLPSTLPLVDPVPQSKPQIDLTPSARRTGQRRVVKRHPLVPETGDVQEMMLGTLA